LFLKRTDASIVPIFLSVNALPVDTGVAIGLLITDLTKEKYYQELAAAHEALHKSEDALSRKEQQLLHISDNTSVIIAQCSSDYRYVFANKACTEFLGRPVEEIVGKQIAEVMGQEAFNAIHPYIEKVLKGERVEYEAEVPYARIGVRHMRVSYVPDFDAAGNICGWIASITDITDRKRTEEALRDSQALLLTFLEQLPVGVGAVDLDGRWTIRNAVMRRFAGTDVSSRDFKSVTRWQAFDSDGQPISSQEWPGVRALRGETVSPGIEMTYTTDAGTQIWTRVSAAPLFNQAGEMIGALSVVQDIDAVKRAELAVREAADRFRSLVSVITDVPWTADPSGAFTTAQPAWAWYTGQAWEEYRGFGWIEALHPDDREDLRKSWLQACTTNSAYVSAHGRLWHDPTRQYRYFEAQATPVFNQDGTVREWVGAYTDINARRQLEQQLEERAAELARALDERKKLDEEREQLLESERYARTEAERSTRLKEEFLSTVSHELRTPLNVILGWTQLMQQSSDAETWKQGLDAIERGARGQALLIDELLDVSRIVSGKLRLEVEVLDIGPLVEAAVETLRPAAEGKSIQVVRNLSLETGPVKGDPARIQQTVWNLLSNAIKFTPKGGTVQIHVQSIDGFVEITVKDTGAGISEEFLPFVFDRFRQADNSTTRAHGGLGLGLAIVKHLMELHGGTVTVQSEGEGKGATFTIRLPLAPSTHEQHGPIPADPSPKKLTNVRVLVVDDDVNSSEIVRRILVGREAQVLIASSADEALKVIEQFEPHVLVSDIGMPGKDGLSLIREIRLHEVRMRVRRLPAVALTAFARPEDRIRVLQAGYNTHVAKPVDPRELVAVVGSLTGQDSGGLSDGELKT
jgi:PAS domain S-box-containing protein